MTEGTSAAIVMPKLGLSMTEGLIAEWLVAPGDEVAAGQLLFVLETDKISNEIEAPAPGGSCLLAAGDTVDWHPDRHLTGPGQRHRGRRGAEPSARPIAGTTGPRYSSLDALRAAPPARIPIGA